jgi:hypothetical protein
VEGLGCAMVGFGCRDNHALKDCMKIRAAVWKHPAFDLEADSPLNSFIGCGRCECTRGDGYIWDDDGENIVDVDTNVQICGHCTNSCWCDQRYWVGGEGYFDFDTGVEVSVFDRKKKMCNVCGGKGCLYDD